MFRFIIVAVIAVSRKHRDTSLFLLKFQNLIWWRVTTEKQLQLFHVSVTNRLALLPSHLPLLAWCRELRSKWTWATRYASQQLQSPCFEDRTIIGCQLTAYLLLHDHRSIHQFWANLCSLLKWLACCRCHCWCDVNRPCCLRCRPWERCPGIRW